MRQRKHPTGLAAAPGLSISVLGCANDAAGGFYLRGLIRLATGEKKNGEADIAAAKALDPKIAVNYAELGFKQ